MFIRGLIKIGNSIGVIIPKPFLEALGWKHGTPLEYQVKDDTLILKKVNKSAPPMLDLFSEDVSGV